MGVKKSSVSQNTKDLVTIIFLFLIPLVGLIVMWAWSGWKLWIKISITATYLLLVFIILPLLFVVAYLFLLRPYEINGIAMDPNFEHGEYVLSTPYMGQPLSRGDIVVFKTEQGKDNIKRVIGLPGDKISIQNYNVFANGYPINEKAYIPNGEITQASNYPKEGEIITVPGDSYYVLGDNRQNSIDSRNFGFIPKEKIVAVGAICYWNCVQYDNEVVPLDHSMH